MKILITDKVADEAVELLKKEGYEVIFDEMDHDALIRNIHEYDALMVRSRTKVTSDIIEAAEKLKVIGRAGIGVDNIDIKAASKHGVKVVNAPTGATDSVAELAIAHMLSLARHLTKADSTLKQGVWAKKQLKGVELNGKTLGIVGAGRIGTALALKSRVFSMKILYTSRHRNRVLEEKLGAKKVSLEELLESSDFVSLHVPLTDDTYHLIGEKELKMMKPTAYIINCARGGIIDEEALYNALKEKKIAGAALDVFEEEPPKDNPLLTLDNVVATPHLGASTVEGQRRAGTVCAEQIIKVLRGEEPDYWVNKG